MLQNIAQYVSSAQANSSFFVPKTVDVLATTVVGDKRLVPSVAVLVAAATYAAYTLFKRLGQHRAPGPARLPILGNLLQMPSSLQFVKYAEWAQKFGNLYSLDILGQHIVVVSDHKGAIELLERRAQIYTGRPRQVLVNEILTQYMYMGFLQHGSLWSRMRRAAQGSFSATGVRRFEPFQTRSAAQMAVLMMQHPEKLAKNLEIFAISSMYTSVYGRYIDINSPIIGRAQKHIDHIMELTRPGIHIYEVFPILKHVPAFLARWKRDALAWHEQEDKFFKQLSLEAHADGFDKANAELNQRGFVAELIQTQDKHGLSEKEASWLAGSMLGVGADTTSVAVTNFFLAMTNFPEVMRKAQAELDTVIGQGRPPTFDDMPNLPYLRAVVKETLRWRPVAPLGMSTLHAANADDHYEGYFIPKGKSTSIVRNENILTYCILTDSIVVANIWAMNRDPTMYPDFDVFRPERFLDESGKNEVVPSGTHNMGHVTFGFGRRNCIGLHFANQSLFIVMATMLWAMDILPPIDENGKVVIPPTNQWRDDGIIVRPKPFDCRFVPRFPEAQAILEASFA
ncbi:cytochrome P450 [Irpex rosettiformis]|uniref:Cytochrome P450 n=1 Tax=Irpex rosettiformis TaxID=378272 RepID=A0ACB8U2U8_9APHY|nr:cytochrome P450 [Irpex rosettiformis]